MDEEQVGRRSKKWIWIPIGVLVALVGSCSFLILKREPSYSFGFLKDSRFLGSHQRIYTYTGAPDAHSLFNRYRIESADKRIRDQVDKELVSAGWKRLPDHVFQPRWENKGTIIYLNYWESNHYADICIQTYSLATPIKRFDVWLSNQTGRNKEIPFP